MNKDFFSGLKQAISGELPGLASQIKMVPEARRKEIEGRKSAGDAKKAAVLICMYPEKEGEIMLVLIRRNEYDGVHSGQISFPGGRYEDDDPSLEYTALREAQEETNIRIEDVEVLGNISPVYIPPSNFYVEVLVGWTTQKPDLKLEPSEVAEILTIPIKEFLDPEKIQQRDIPHREFNILDVPCFYVQGDIIWGATAMMLAELGDIILSLES
jgi:8-oxo-dGTP pyrophosphatase MutT (NUDIX family)